MIRPGGELNVNFFLISFEALIRPVFQFGKLDICTEGSRGHRP